MGYFRHLQAEFRKGQNTASKFRNQYSYSDLEHERSIRLLQIVRYRPNDDFKLRCIIRSFDLDAEPPDYDALSYTWGPPLNTVECAAEYGPDRNIGIALEDSHGHAGSMSIGRNLYEALTQLWELQTEQCSSKRDENEPTLARWLWVDAVCINQKNETEKSSQVSFMNEIYANARTVFAWLGLDDGTFEAVATFHLECGDRMGAWVSNCNEQDTKTPTRFEHTPYGISISDIDIKMAYWLVRKVAIFFARRRYLSRLWVLQEMAFAKSPVILLGNRALPFRMFADCGLFMMYNYRLAQAFTHSVISEVGFADSDSTIFGSFNFFRGFLFDPEIGRNTFKTIFGRTSDEMEVFCLCFLLVVQQTRTSGCADPRDRIYALLSIAKGSIAPDFEPPVLPDYTVTREQLYFKTMSMLLAELPYLSALGLVDHDRGSQIAQRPSWIPTFGLNRVRRRGSIGWAKMRAPKGRTNMFNASGKFSYPSGVKSFTESELQLKGKQAGAVSTCFLDTAADENYVSARRPTYSGLVIFLLERFDKLGPQYWTGQPIGEAIMQTLTLDDYDEEAVEEKVHSFKAWIASSIAWFQFRQDSENEANFKTNVASMPGLLDKIAGVPGAPTKDEVASWLAAFEKSEREADLKYDRETTRFLSDFLSSSITSSIISTENSIGLGPIAVQPGDEVWVLIPGQCLHILRPTEDASRYLFVGEAYVHGLMYGEAVEGLPETELEHVTLI